jgi:HAD superfamily hydrolase (TIGR01549 family)
MSRQSTEPAILFDLDGTLVDTVYQRVLAWSTAIARAGMSVPAWAIHRRIGMSGRSMLQQLLRGHRLSSAALKKLEEGHDATFKKISIDVRPLPGAKELLRHLTQIGIPWAIATTGGRTPTNSLLRHLDIPEKAVVVTGDDVAKAKPSPDVFLAAAQRLRLPIEHCIVVGDSVWDMLAAPKGARCENSGWWLQRRRIVAIRRIPRLR